MTDGLIPLIAFCTDNVAGRHRQARSVGASAGRGRVSAPLWSNARLVLCGYQSPTAADCRLRRELTLLFKPAASRNHRFPRFGKIIVDLHAFLIFMCFSITTQCSEFAMLTLSPEMSFQCSD